MMSPHPDDEALSAALDGEDPAAAGHAASCADCRARMTALAGAAALVATVVAPPAEHERDRAVAAAMANAGDRVVAPPTAGTDSRWRPVLVAAAAVVLVVGIVAGVASLSSGGSKPATTASRAPASIGNAQPPAATANASAGSLNATSAPADLGAVPDEATLRQRLNDALTARKSSATGDSAAGSTQAAPSALAASQCEAPAVRSAGPNAQVVFRATLTYAGQPADVVVVKPEPSAPQLLAIVTARSTCSTLARAPVGP
ncbi:MAG: hypothetical protein JWO37_2027 [Acidimicrobiales bacterium]|jgi:hypothetical protein|nr:hypothetical protein [Acidimicrobiales bacterium]